MRKLYETQQQEQQAGKYLYSAVGIMRRAQPGRLPSLRILCCRVTAAPKKSGQLSPGSGNNWPLDNSCLGGSESVDGMPGSAVFIELVTQGAH